MSTKLVAASASCMLRNSYPPCSWTLPRFSWVSVGLPVSSVSYDGDVTFSWSFIRLLLEAGIAAIPCSLLSQTLQWESAYQCTNTLNGSGQELRAVCHGHKDGKIGREGGVIIHHCFRAHMFLLPSMFSSPTISTRISSSEPYPSMTCCHTRGPMAFTAVRKYRILSIYWHDLGFMRSI